MGKQPKQGKPDGSEMTPEEEASNILRETCCGHCRYWASYHLLVPDGDIAPCALHDRMTRAAYCCWSFAPRST